METYGLVIETKNKTAVVKVVRQSSCGGNCSSCGACGNREIHATVNNDAGAKKGDVVRIVSSTSQVLKTAFLLYFLPVLLFILIYLVLSPITGTVFSICTAFLLVGLLYFILKRSEKKLTVSSKIVEILKETN